MSRYVWSKALAAFLSLVMIFSTNSPLLKAEEEPILSPAGTPIALKAFSPTNAPSPNQTVPPPSINQAPDYPLSRATATSAPEGDLVTPKVPIKNYQMVNGYSVHYGQAYAFDSSKDSHWVSSGYGLVFSKWTQEGSQVKQIAVVVDFPKDNTVELDGKKYWIEMNAKGEVSLIDEFIPMGQLRIKLLIEIETAIQEHENWTRQVQTRYDEAREKVEATINGFKPKVSTEKNNLKDLVSELSQLFNQSGLSQETKEQIAEFLKDMAVYLSEGQGSLSEKIDQYAEALRKQALAYWERDLGREKQYLDLLKNHTAKVMAAKTYEELEKLHEIPTLLNPLGQISIPNPELLNPLPQLIVLIQEANELIGKAKKEINEAAALIGHFRIELLIKIETMIQQRENRMKQLQTQYDDARTTVETLISAFIPNVSTEKNHLKDLVSELSQLFNQSGLSQDTKEQIAEFLKGMEVYLSEGPGSLTEKLNQYLDRLRKKALAQMESDLLRENQDLMILKNHKARVAAAKSLDELEKLEEIPALIHPFGEISIPNPELSNPMPQLIAFIQEASGWIQKAKEEIELSKPKPVTTSFYDIPPNKAEGGIDVNILDWDLMAFAEKFQVYRRVFGESEWTLVHETTALRFIDRNIDGSVPYQYEVKVKMPGDPPKTVNIVYRSANYKPAGGPGLKPENVLVLINTNDYGFVDISERVQDFEKANGKLNPITESELLRYLGLPSNALADGAEADWAIVKDKFGKIKVPLGLYYAIRRGIPKENIVFIDGVPTAEREDIGQSAFTQQVINPIKQHMIQKGLTYQITSIVSAYHFPIIVNDHAWESELNYGLWKAFGESSISFTDVIDQGRPFSRILGDPGFLTTRIDAADIRNARRIVDDSIWAEENYLFDNPAWREQSDLKAYIEWKGKYDFIDDYFLEAADIIKNSGLFGAKGEDWDLTPDLSTPGFIDRYDANKDHKLDHTFLFEGWYHYFDYQDVFNWARGSMGWSLDSASAYSFRGGNSWGANIINQGAVASLGAVFEPNGGHTRPNLFSHYMLEGYSFAEAGYLASPQNLEAWMYAFNGDPLYAPFKIRGPGQVNNKREAVVADNVTVGYRVYDNDSLHLPKDRYVGGEKITSSRSYKEYDVEGHLVTEKLENGVIVRHFVDGRTVFYRPSSGSGSLGTNWFIYDKDGSLLKHSWLSGRNLEKDEIRMVDGAIRIFRFSGRSDVLIFDENGAFLSSVTKSSLHLYPF